MFHGIGQTAASLAGPKSDARIVAFPKLAGTVNHAFTRQLQTSRIRGVDQRRRSEAFDAFREGRHLGIVRLIGRTFEHAVFLHEQVDARLEKNRAAQKVPLGTTTTPPPFVAQRSMADWMAFVFSVRPPATAPESVMR